jgi:hypothetical protein
MPALWQRRPRETIRISYRFCWSMGSFKRSHPPIRQHKLYAHYTSEPILSEDAPPYYVALLGGYFPRHRCGCIVLYALHRFFVRQTLPKSECWLLQKVCCCLQSCLNDVAPIGVMNGLHRCIILASLRQILGQALLPLQHSLSF